MVRADTSKTRERRTVDLSANAVAWLRAVRPKDAAGRVFPFSASTLARKRADLVEKANVTWLKDGFRHTFASAHMAKHGDATKTMLALGQKDLKMIWQALLPPHDRRRGREVLGACAEKLRVSARAGGAELKAVRRH